VGRSQVVAPDVADGEHLGIRIQLVQQRGEPVGLARVDDDAVEEPFQRERRQRLRNAHAGRVGDQDALRVDRREEGGEALGARTGASSDASCARLAA
jgi:hypothetical protein